MATLATTDSTPGSRAVLLDQPRRRHSGCSRGQRDFGAPAIERPHELRAQFLAVVGCPHRLSLEPRGIVDRAGETRLVAIEMAEAGRVQRLRRGPATSAAECTRLAIDVCAEDTGLGQACPQ